MDTIKELKKNAISECVKLLDNKAKSTNDHLKLISIPKTCMLYITDDHMSNLHGIGINKFIVI